MMYVLALFAGLFFLGAESADWLEIKWVAIIALAGVFITKSSLKTHFWLALALMYTVASGLFFSMTPYSYREALPAIDQTILALSGTKALLYLAALAALLLGAIDYYLWVWAGLWLAGLASALWLFLAVNLDWYLKGPDFNPSMSATLVALLFPFVLARFPKSNWRHMLAKSLPIAAVVYSKSAIGVVALLAGVVAWAPAAIAIPAASLAAVALAALVSVTGSQFFNFSGRLEIWGAIVKFMSESPERIATGFGLGSYYPYGPIIQDVAGRKFNHGALMVTAHNDILQCAFELGLIGLALWLAAFASSFWYVRKIAWARSFFVVMAFASLGNFPHHMAFESFLIAWMYFRAMAENQTRLENLAPAK